MNVLSSLNFGVAVFVFGAGLVQISMGNIGLAGIDFGLASFNVFIGLVLTRKVL